MDVLCIIKHYINIPVTVMVFLSIISTSPSLSWFFQVCSQAVHSHSGPMTYRFILKHENVGNTIGNTIGNSIGNTIKDYVKIMDELCIVKPLY